MADRLVDLEGQLARFEDEVERPGRAFRSGEQGDRLLGDPPGVGGEVEAADDLVAAGLELPEALRVGATLGLDSPMAVAAMSPPASTRCCEIR